MVDKKKPITKAEWEKISSGLESAASLIRARPEVNHHFADRLSLIAKQMREDFLRPTSTKKDK
jgi:hypothetical protein